MLFKIANMFLGAAIPDTTTDTIDTLVSTVGEQIKSAVQKIVPVLFAVIASIGVIYGIVLGVQYAKAEDTQKREEAKKRLINAIIGFGIAVLIAGIMWILAGQNSIWEGLFPAQA